MRRRWRFAVGALGVALLALPWACGVDFIGERPSTSTVDGGDGEGGASLPDSAVRDALEEPIDFDAVSDFDAGEDANVACEKVCTKGTCIAGVCHLACTSDAPCSGNPCPAGVRCVLRCTSDGGEPACTDNVDCTDCTVTCTGMQACTGDVSCTGIGCQVRCCGDAPACLGNTTCSGAGCNVICAPDAACGLTPTCNGDACEGGIACN